jgi:hypothetical protein
LAGCSRHLIELGIVSDHWNFTTHSKRKREKRYFTVVFGKRTLQHIENGKRTLNIEYRKWKKKPAPHLARIMHYAMHYATSCEAIVKTSWFELKPQLTGSNSKPNSLIDHNFTR